MDEQESTGHEPKAKQDPLGEASEPRGDLSKEEKTWGMAAHLSALSGAIGIPFGNVLGPLVVYLIKKDESEFIRNHAKEAMNFGITVTLAVIISIPLCFILIGFFTLAVVLIGALVLNIIAAIKANEGRTYRYPYTLRLIS